MNLADCTKFANENKICYLATVDGNQPRVRAMLLWFADEGGFYFHTGAPKEMVRQMKSNPKAELCFFAPGANPGRMMRVTGAVEFVDDTALKARLLEERPFLKNLSSGPDDPFLVLFRICKGEAWFWTMADNLREREIERIKF